MLSDQPACVCPVIAAIVRDWNDALDDDERDVLEPVLLRLIGTRGSDALARRRAMMAADWLVREHLPACLRVAGFRDHADALAAMPEFTSATQTRAICAAINAMVGDWNAAHGIVAGWFNGKSVWRGFSEIFPMTSDDAIWATVFAAVAAAEELKAKAWDVPRETLEETFQRSALDLLNRMIEARE